MPSFTRLLSLAFLVLLARVADAAPTIWTRIPASGATGSSLTSISITYSEAITGVDADDMLINAERGSFVTGPGAGPYVFTFDQAAVGAVSFTWAAGHGIADVAAEPNVFAGTGWPVARSASGIGTLIINEFLAANGTGLADENADQEDWIEILDPGASTVSFAGWSLTNDPGDPRQ